jgi:hypothetical protein
VAAELLGMNSSSGSSGGGSASKRCRGPVLRMGLAEGTPHSILPDHLVRLSGHSSVWCTQQTANVTDVLNSCGIFLRVGCFFK